MDGVLHRVSNIRTPHPIELFGEEWLEGEPEAEVKTSAVCTNYPPISKAKRTAVSFKASRSVTRATEDLQPGDLIESFVVLELGDDDRFFPSLVFQQ
ncbi:MAG: hypothetical protein IPH48_12705 [bacterium]|nr:hypothetical protein [bacterium]